MEADDRIKRDLGNSGIYYLMRNQRKEIQKEKGKVRALGIPTIKDQMFQGTIKPILEPIFEADFQYGSFGYRWVKTHQGKWGAKKARKALLQKLKDIFRRYKFQPLSLVIYIIKPILRGWVNYFRDRHSSRCFRYIRDWVEKKIRRHFTHARKCIALVGTGGVEHGFTMLGVYTMTIG